MSRPADRPGTRRATHLMTYLALVRHGEDTLADAFDTVGDGHREHPDVVFICAALAAMSRDHVARLAPMDQRYGSEDSDAVAEPERLRADGLAGARTGPVGLLRDLQDLHMLANLVDTSWSAIGQAAQGLRDEELLELSRDARADVARQLTWLTTRMAPAAPQALIVAP